MAARRSFSYDMWLTRSVLRGTNSLYTYSFGKTLGSEEDVHFLKTQTLCLGHDEPYEEDAEERHQSEEDESPVCDVLNHIWRDLSNDEIGHPVG